MRALTEAGLSAHLEGSGVVTTQTPAEGSITPRGSFVRVVLGRPSVLEDVVLPTETDAPEETPAAPSDASAQAAVVPVSAPARARRPG